MDNPLHAKYYADTAGSYDVTIQERRTLAHETFLVRFECPELAERITPGQFLMIRSHGSSDPLLGRAFALYDVIRDSAGQPKAIDIVFHVVGKMTSLLASCSVGDRFQVWGPLGNGFATIGESTQHLIMVAGGIGQTPFLTMAKESLGIDKYGERQSRIVPKVSLCYGARSTEHLAGVSDFESAGVDVHVATDDGSSGHHGLVTEVLSKVVDAQEHKSALRLICCGPEPMMEAVANYAAEHQLICQVSLETPMACGLGICFSCVTRVKQPDGEWDFKRTCVDGPVFDSDQLVW